MEKGQLLDDRANIVVEIVGEKSPNSILDLSVNLEDLQSSWLPKMSLNVIYAFTFNLYS